MENFVRKKFTAIIEELKGYTSRERAFIFFATLCGFFICCEYSMIRPVSNSLFIYSFGAHYFPYAWIAMVPFNLFLVNVYNRLLPKWGSKRIFTVLTCLVVVMNISFALFYKFIPSLAFPFYIWKELYIMLMFQLLWSVIHANVKFSRAKYLYGIFFGFGAIGSMIGSSLPGFFAVSYGSENLIYFTVPICAMLFIAYFKLNHYSSGDVPHHQREENGGIIHGIKLIAGSRFLIFTLLIVIFMQMIAAITDFQVNDFLEKTFSEKDIRTEYSARIMGIIHTLTLALQFVGTYVLIKVIGFRKLHYIVPTVIALSASFLLFAPTFPLVSCGFIACKTLDFSIFGVIKEMLYVPLKPDEKFRAKAVIDVFAYRTSKAFASILILAMTQFFNSTTLAWVTIALAALWMAAISYGLKEYHQLTSTQEA